MASPTQASCMNILRTSKTLGLIVEDTPNFLTVNLNLNSSYVKLSSCFPLKVFLNKLLRGCKTIVRYSSNVSLLKPDKPPTFTNNLQHNTKITIEFWNLKTRSSGTNKLINSRATEYIEVYETSALPKGANRLLSR